MALVYKIDGIIFNDIERQDIVLKLGGSEDTIDVDVSNVRLLGAARDMILQQTSNIYSVQKKIQFQILYNNDVIFDGYFTFRNRHNLQPNCDYIDIEVTDNTGKAALLDLASSVTVQGLYHSGNLAIKLAQYLLEYQLSNVPDRQSIAIGLLGAATTVISLTRSITEISKSTSRMSNPFTATEAVALSIEIANTAVLITTLIKYIIDIYNALVPREKRTTAVNLLEVLNKGLWQIGYQLDISMLDNKQNDILANSFIILSRREDGGLLSSLTLLDVINEVKKIFNVKTFVKNNRLYFGKAMPNLGVFVINDYTLIERYLDLNDIPKSIVLKFSYDNSDLNTVSHVIGNYTQAFFNRIGETTFNELKFARAKRKDNFLVVEEVFKVINEILKTLTNTLIVAINAIIQIINGIISGLNALIRTLRRLGIRINPISVNINPIPNVDIGRELKERIGNMIVESDGFTVDKLARLDVSVPDEAKILPDNKDIINTKYFFDNFYTQRFVKEVKKLKTYLCYDSFKQLKNSTYVSIDGTEYEIVEISYNIANTETELIVSRNFISDIQPIDVLNQ